ncbi:MAG: hypothetical protein ABII82_08390 [Verrucomicrobiota bacterium]
MVEGDTERAFVGHLRALFARNCGTRLTIECAYGGSGDAILDHALKLCPGFDRRAVIYDADRPPTLKTLLQKAHAQKLDCIVSAPAIEAVLLAILDQPVPRDTETCKRALAALISDSLTDVRNYSRHFPESLLRAKATTVPALARLLALMNYPATA